MYRVCILLCILIVNHSTRKIMKKRNCESNCTLIFHEILQIIKSIYTYDCIYDLERQTFLIIFYLLLEKSLLMLICIIFVLFAVFILIWIFLKHSIQKEREGKNQFKYSLWIYLYILWNMNDPSCLGSLFVLFCYFLFGKGSIILKKVKKNNLYSFLDGFLLQKINVKPSNYSYFVWFLVDCCIIDGWSGE